MDRLELLVYRTRRRLGLKAEPPAVTRRGPLKRGRSPGRNDPCPCKSGKKFKQCCRRKSQPGPAAP